jgi:hypothetical protein
MQRKTPKRINRSKQTVNKIPFPNLPLPNKFIGEAPEPVKVALKEIIPVSEPLQEPVQIISVKPKPQLKRVGRVTEPLESLSYVRKQKDIGVPVGEVGLVTKRDEKVRAQPKDKPKNSTIDRKNEKEKPKINKLKGNIKHQAISIPDMVVGGELEPEPPTRVEKDGYVIEEATSEDYD